MGSRAISEIGLLTALIAVTGAFRLPSIFPGADFQLSAPAAVAVCGVFGFKKYIVAGTLASAIGLITGTQTVFSVGIAFVFRLTAGCVVALHRRNLWVIAIAGPIATGVSRLCFSYVLGVPFQPLLLAAAPGMLYTAVLAIPLTKALRLALRR